MTLFEPEWVSDAKTEIADVLRMDVDLDKTGYDFDGNPEVDFVQAAEVIGNALYAAGFLRAPETRPVDQRAAFKETLRLAGIRGLNYTDTRDELSYRHLVDMLERVTPDFSEAKLGRWLGWAQAAVVASGKASLQEMNELNRRFQAEEDE